MKSGTELSVILIIALLFFSVFIFAAGGSSGGSSGGGSSGEVSSSTVPKVTTVNCEELGSVSGRINCRFENKDNLEYAEEEVEDEACRNHVKTQECIELYANSASCYEMTGIAKQRCFIQKAGLSENQDLRTASSKGKRNYIVLLLYEIQERIEDKHENGVLSTSDAANLVSTIVEIKKDIILGISQSVIKPKIQSFKTKYFEIVR